MAEKKETRRAGDILAEAVRRLTGKSDTAALDAQVLLAHILGRSRTWVLAHPEAALNSIQSTAYEQALRQAEDGIPLPYLTGKQEFYGIEFLVNPDVLIPRPETEHLIEEALAWLKAHPQRRRAADIGTGSGCIAVTLALNCADLICTAADVSWEALGTARRNAIRLGVGGTVRFVQADLLTPMVGGFDLLCANLPYGSRANLPLPPAAGVTGEPRLAIEGGEDGLNLIRRFLGQAPACLSREGLLLMEIEAFQGEAVRSLAQAAFPSAVVAVLPDLAGLDRIVRIQNQAGLV